MNSKRLSYLLTLVTLVVSSGCGTSLPDIAKIRSQMTPEQLGVGDPIVNSKGMIFVPIPAGEFQMGTPVPSGKGNKKSQLPPGADAEQPQHMVQIKEPYFMSVCEVTQSHYQQVMDESPWKDQPLTKAGDHVAASYVSWAQANAFCQKLSELENAKYRLPTEAEWEYACRAGTTTRYSFGDDGNPLTDYSWFDQNAYKAKQQYAQAVAQKLPNAWSLYDMHGNVWEWCSDFHGSYQEQLKRSKGKALIDPSGPDKGWQHVWRGGGFAENAVNLRSASRSSYGRVDYRPEFMAGFRVVKEIP